MLLVVPAGMAAAVAAYFAPAPLALLLGERDTTHRALMPDQQMAWIALGGRFEDGQTWTHAMGVESFRGSLHGELTAEDLWRPRHIQYVSVRGSYLWHSRQHVAGGVSIGYMHADVEPTQRGIELGLPLLLADAERRDVRLEPTYVLGPSGVVFNYRLEVHAPVARSRFVVGASVLAKGNPAPPRAEAYPGDFTGTGYMLLLGTRF